MRYQWRPNIVKKVAINHTWKNKSAAAIRQSYAAQSLLHHQHNTYFNGVATVYQTKRLFGTRDYFIPVDNDSKINLARLQTNFEENSSNLDAAEAYFKQLNREGKYSTVVRLYKSNELQFRRQSNSSHDKVQEQYRYARETMEFLETAINDNKGYNSYSSGSGAGDQNFDWTFLFRNIFMLTIKRVTITGIFFFIMSYIIEKLGQDSMLSKDPKFEIKKAGDIAQRLDDVKGIDEIKDEITNLIKMIKEPEQYRDKGAKLHKGVLFFGEPGTGKTLLARAIAGEAGVNFIFCTGSDFDEMFVGVGAKRVRQLFKKAREESPCIIFIDEIDSLLSGSRRESGEHSSQRATINQILAEMDGFEKNENILLIGATNHQ